MPRELSPLGLLELQKEVLSEAYLLELECDEFTLRFNSRNSILSYDGALWEAAPDQWKVTSGLVGSSALVPEALTMEFDGGYQYDSGSIVARLLGATWHRRPMAFHALLLTPDNNVVDRHYEWRGRIDKISSTEAIGGMSIISLIGESGTFRALDASNGTCSDVDQRSREPTDTFFENMASKRGKQWPFGQKWSEIPGASDGITATSQSNTGRPGPWWQRR